MISDVLSHAVAEIDRYLTAMPFAPHYDGAMCQRIRTCRNEMQDIRRLLDTLPCKQREKQL